MTTKYNLIGKNYNQTRKADPSLATQHISFLRPKTNGVYLDIGCGTGNYTIALQKEGLKMIGIDPSEQMIEVAKSRNQEVDWRIGTAEKTGLPNNCLEGITAFLTIHHWCNLSDAFAELYRVLKPNGKIVIFTSSPTQMEGYWLNHYFPQMMNASITQMPSLQRVEKAMKIAGFNNILSQNYLAQPELEDHFLYRGKHNPQLYFNKTIQQGISSFSDSANKQEIEMGLEQLKNDIEYGNMLEIMNQYKNQKGDYMFVMSQLK